MTWWRIWFEAPAALAEAVAWQVAEAIDEVAEVQDEVTMTRGAEAGDAGPTCRVVTGLSAPPDDADRQAIIEAVMQLGLPAPHLRLERSDDESWREGWRAFFKGGPLSPRVSVRPPWQVPTDDRPVQIIIDPGMAFGTGTHETTRGVMARLDALLEARAAPPTLLDVGCGSGILSLATTRLGAQVTGVEIDPVALENARHNADLNQLSESVTWIEGGPEAVKGTFEVVVANILANILVEIAPGLIERTGETLILSGLIERDLPAIRAAFSALEEIHHTTEGPWQVLTYVRR